jgi:hypothetical protein
MPTSVELVVVDELGVRPLCPTPRNGIDLVWKDAHSNRDADVFRRDNSQLVFPVETSRRDRRVRQPIECDVVEDVIPREVFSFPSKTRAISS